MAVIGKITDDFVNSRLKLLLSSIDESEAMLKRFKETRELVFLFELTGSIRSFGCEWFYLTNTDLNQAQKKIIVSIETRFDNIENYIKPEIENLRKCKV